MSEFTTFLKLVSEYDFPQQQPYTGAVYLDVKGDKVPYVETMVHNLDSSHISRDEHFHSLASDVFELASKTHGVTDFDTTKLKSSIYPFRESDYDRFMESNLLIGKSIGNVTLHVFNSGMTTRDSAIHDLMRAPRQSELYPAK